MLHSLVKDRKLNDKIYIFVLDPLDSGQSDSHLVALFFIMHITCFFVCTLRKGNVPSVNFSTSPNMEIPANGYMVAKGSCS